MNKKSMVEYIEDFEKYMVLSFDFIKGLPPSILLSNDKKLKTIQKAKDLMCDDIQELLKICMEKNK